jgi:chromosome segregation ATPase
MTGVKLDETNARLTETIRVLHETLEAALAKMVTKDEFKALEEKHYALVARVDKMEKDLVERLERMIREVQAQVDAVVRRVTITEQQIETLQDEVRKVEREVGTLRARFVPLEEQMPLKADKAELEAAIAEIRAELEAMNIEEIMEMAKKANERIDIMDVRCDNMVRGPSLFSSLLLFSSLKQHPGALRTKPSWT